MDIEEIMAKSWAIQALSLILLWITIYIIVFSVRSRWNISTTDKWIVGGFGALIIATIPMCYIRFRSISGGWHPSDYPTNIIADTSARDAEREAQRQLYINRGKFGVREPTTYELSNPNLRDDDESPSIFAQIADSFSELWKIITE